ncbi:hypothetical protein [Kamptonema formosum]|uniref:hypothetical protein n=1 Tax=Kamptonema formosum TaxID=331992 RepID=UPI0012DFC958|nr:hypothetical protein [Oscillatoria sp. PCC 10802]
MPCPKLAVYCYISLGEFTGTGVQRQLCPRHPKTGANLTGILIRGGGEGHAARQTFIILLSAEMFTLLRAAE